MKVLFFGNHDVGIEALATLRETEEIVGVVAHPPDPEDGARYGSVYEFACDHRWHVIRSSGKNPTLAEFVRSLSPDLMWITDYRYILPTEIISLPRLGAVNLHPSLLPKYRGRAPINWAIIHGETRLGLTAHFVDEGLDTGDIIDQVSYELTQEQDAGDALDALYPLYRDLTRRVMKGFRAGALQRTPQDHRLATEFPRRRPEDGKIDWAAPKRSIWNLIRAVAFPYPGAFTSTPGGRLTVWKARESVRNARPHAEPGTILAVDDQGVHVQCSDGALILTKIEPDKGMALVAGLMVLG